MKICAIVAYINKAVKHWGMFGVSSINITQGSTLRGNRLTNEVMRSEKNTLFWNDHSTYSCIDYKL